MASLDIVHLNKVYDNHYQAIKDVNLSIQDGEFIVLVGPSGCGKSTLLNMIAGLEDISSGILKIDDLTVNDLPAKERDIAMVFQNYALYPHMTVYKNMAFSLKLRRISKEEIDRRVQKAAEILGIGHLLNRLPKQLSGGQRQRVAVGRAIVRQPAVFLFDEPLSNLDAKLRVQMRVEIKELHQRLRTTMIYVTHDQTEAMTMGDRIVVLKDGIVQQVATPLELYHQPANRFVASFIGTPPMNFFDGELVSRGDRLIFNQKDGDVEVVVPKLFHQRLNRLRRETVTLGIRPEGIGSTRGESRSDTPKISGRIKVIEPMGSESYLHIDGGSMPFVARVDEGQFHVGDHVRLSVLEEKMYFFEANSEKAVI